MSHEWFDMLARKYSKLLSTVYSSFANTDLDFQLRKHGIDKVIMAGMVANTCLESSARYAMEL